jgi:CxxC-x17-CxxC domain-containing protein
MKNFQPGGLRNRRDDIGGRPRRDVGNYAPKTRSANSNFTKSYGEKRSGGFNPKDRAPREQKSFSATCSTCGKACDVPFKPDGVKPVLCRECFATKNSSNDTAHGNRDRFSHNKERSHTTAPVATTHTQTGVSAEAFALVQTQLTMLEDKVNQILSLLQTTNKSTQTAPDTVLPKSVKPTKATKVAKPKKVAAVKKVAAKVAKKAVKKKSAKKA